MNEKRVVSLVPSVTESLVDLGLGDRLVGVTDYCVHPADKLAHLPRLGGTKDPRIAEIVALVPDLVIANQEENTQASVEALQAAGLTVWVTFPRTVREALDVLWDITRRFNVPQQGHRLAALEKVLEWAEAAAGNATPARVFCPIWRGDDWWMTANGATYVSDLLRVCGGENVFAERERRYPLAADLEAGRATQAVADSSDTRYPRVGLAEILAAWPQVILLPSEPYAFGQAEADFWMAQADLPAVQNGRVHRVDGSLLTWHGTRLAKALQEIPSLLMQMDA